MLFILPEKGRSQFYPWMFHDWHDEQCLKLLKNCYDAIPNDEKGNYWGTSSSNHDKTSTLLQRPLLK